MYAYASYLTSYIDPVATDCRQLAQYNNLKMSRKTPKAGALKSEGGIKLEPVDDSSAYAGKSEKEIMDELLKPVGTVEEKWKLLPHFLRLRGLMRQHIDSFNHFISVEIKNVVAAKSNYEVRSEADPKFFLRYTDIYVGEPSVDEEAFVTSNVTPFQCRLRDCTYSAPLFVNVKYTRNKQIISKNGKLMI